ncbi:MAG: M14-type cytosolic carboxypeptidase [Alphaproteobacteria bacterium]
MIAIDSNFEGGSIAVRDASDAGNVRLNLKTDENAEESYWFFFRISGARGQTCRLVIENAGGAFRLAERKATDIPGPYQDYRACGSDDRATWCRVPTAFEDGALVITVTPDSDTFYLASFAPYSFERHCGLIAKAATAPHVTAAMLGSSPDGNAIDLLQIGAGGQGKKICWITARQHPSETMAAWFAEGLIERLIDPDDFLSRKLLRDCVFYIVPCMNPDGARQGKTRRNGGNVDLNREWVDPSATRSPEVFHVRNLMHRTGVDFYMDVHGDEELPYVFLGGPLEVPALTPAMRENFYAFEAALQQANPDYKTGYAYPGKRPETANLQMAWNYIGETFKCLSILVEQPFKDCEHALDAEKGYSPERAKRLGAASLVALNAVLPSL